MPRYVVRCALGETLWDAVDAVDARRSARGRFGKRNGPYGAALTTPSTRHIDGVEDPVIYETDTFWRRKRRGRIA